MGLDFIACIKMREEDREVYIRKYHTDELMAGASLADLVDKHAPKTEKPCRIVGAPKMKDLPDFRERAFSYLNDRKEHAIKEMASDPKFRNQSFIDYWLSRTLEQQMADDGQKYCCDQCPLLKALQGSDSRDNPFLGITVASCDFRGKRIGSDGELGELADEAYNDHDPEEMFDYANRLEQKLQELRENGALAKDSYEAYVKEFRSDPWAKMTKQKILTREEYSMQPHWREQNIREAVHWLRTCAGYGVSMAADY